MLGWKKRRNQLLREFETHIEIEIQENINNGMSPEEARHAAKKKFGNVGLTVEKSREVWGGLWLERLLQDIRYAVRSLSGVPAYTATLVCTLVLGLGCVTTMLAVIQSTLMQPVALPHSEQLVQVYTENSPDGTYASPQALSYKEIDELRRGNRSFTGVGGYNTMVRPVTASDGTRIAVLTEVTSDYFQMLGVQARLGRLILPADTKSPVVVVSHEFWSERLHADPRAIGSTIKVSGELRTVIGVLPLSIHVPQGTGGPIVYVPVSLDASGDDDYKLESASTIARLKPGVSMQQALADAQSIFAHSEPGNAAQDRHLGLRSYRDLVVGDMQKPLLTLLGGVGVLLLIACANAANLQIGRAASRMPEMTVRSALGASFGRLLQQLVTESILISLFSAALGSALSYAAVEVIRHAYGNQFPRFDELSIRPIVLAGTAVLAVLVGVVASIAPALNIRRKTTSRFNTKNATRKTRLPGILVALQVALTCVLLVISGLFVRTLQQLQNVKLGFDPRGVTTLVLMPENQNQDQQLSREIEARLLRRFEALPGIQSVTMQTEIPFSNYNMVLDGRTDVSGRTYQKGDSALYSLVSTSFVHTSGIRLLKGRSFLTEDDTSGSLVVLVNEAFLQKYLDGRQPLGTTLKFHRDPGDTDTDLPFTQPMTVVGVVENEIQGGDLGAPYQPMIYVDSMQIPKNSPIGLIFNMTAQYAVRSSLGPAALSSELRAALKDEAPTMIEMSLRPMQDGISQSLGQRQLALRLVAGFGIVALALSAVGIYGVLAYSVALRRREIGIRMSLGSSRLKVAGLVMRQAGAMVLLGLIPGIAGAWAAGHAVRSFLYGVSALDAATLVYVGVVLVLVSAAAAFFPALRAAQIDPVEILRAE
ncbi:ADOP family duplicated permease [Acidicapsa ligni]|uniref:ADOP family duplicated permease n=1 Tax=Acidicapsa ligni TaxID=542300 RepID=UPI0021DF59DE|nr:ADOP family duplicated permease [Acidicapsa ligni]